MEEEKEEDQNEENQDDRWGPWTGNGEGAGKGTGKAKAKDKGKGNYNEEAEARRFKGKGKGKGNDSGKEGKNKRKFPEVEAEAEEEEEKGKGKAKGKAKGKGNGAEVEVEAVQEEKGKGKGGKGTTKGVSSIVMGTSIVKGTSTVKWQGKSKDEGTWKRVDRKAVATGSSTGYGVASGLEDPEPALRELDSMSAVFSQVGRGTGLDAWALRVQSFKLQFSWGQSVLVGSFIMFKCCRQSSRQQLLHAVASLTLHEALVCVGLVGGQAGKDRLARIMPASQQQLTSSTVAPKTQSHSPIMVIMAAVLRLPCRVSHKHAPARCVACHLTLPI